MFTGIVERRAAVLAATRHPGGLRLAVGVRAADGPDGVPWRPVKLGESIAVDGVCLTAVEFENREDGGSAVFDAIPETLARTTLGELETGDGVNIERSLRAGDTFGGHYVTGHVDGTGRVRSRRREGDQVLFTIETPAPLLAAILPKGSVAVDGISLTVTEVDRREGWFRFAAIPHTLERTTLDTKDAGARVNLETDAFAKWVLHGFRELLGGASAEDAGLAGAVGELFAGLRRALRAEDAR